MANPVKNTAQQVVVVANGRCIESWKRDGNGNLLSDPYEIVPESDTRWMISDGDSAWDVKLPLNAFTSPNDLYIMLNKDEADAQASVISGTDADRRKFYQIQCFGVKSLGRRLSVAMNQIYQDMDRADLPLPSDEKCFDQYILRFTMAEGMLAAARLGMLADLQRFLGLPSAQFTEDTIIKKFKEFLLPQPCAAEVKATAQASPQANTTPPSVSQEPTVSAAVLKNIRVVDSVNNARERAAAREAGESVSVTRAMIRGIPRAIPVGSHYTSWVAFGLSPSNPDGDLRAVVQRLIASITTASQKDRVSPSQFRVILLTQRPSDTTRAVVDAVEATVVNAGIAVSKLHQLKPVYRVEDIMQKGKTRLTSQDERLADSVIIAVVPASAPMNVDKITEYYTAFLNRQEDGYMIGSDIGHKIRTLEF